MPPLRYESRAVWLLAMHEFGGGEGGGVDMVGGGFDVEFAEFNYYVQRRVRRVIGQEQIRYAFLLQMANEFGRARNDFRAAVNNPVHINKITVFHVFCFPEKNCLHPLYEKYVSTRRRCG